MKNLFFSLMVLASFSWSLLAQTEDTVLLISQPEKINVPEKETSNATDITGFYQKPDQPSYLKVPPPTLKDKATEKLEDDQEKDNTNYFRKRTQGNIQFNYSEFSNDYVISKTMAGYVSLTQPSRVGNYSGGAVSFCETKWAYNDLADFPGHWGFSGLEQQIGLYYVLQSSGKEAAWNYQCLKLGYIYTKGTMDGGFDNDVHLKKTYSRGEIFAGFEVDLHSTEAVKDKKMIDWVNRSSFIIYGYVPVGGQSKTKIDDVVQPKEPKTDNDRWKVYAQLEVSFLSFPIFKKNVGIVLSGALSYQHQGKALNIWGFGGSVKINYKYNELVKFQGKAVEVPSDDSPTGSSIFWSVGADIWNFLRMTGWSIFNK